MHRSNALRKDNATMPAKTRTVLVTGIAALLLVTAVAIRAADRARAVIPPGGSPAGRKIFVVTAAGDICGSTPRSCEPTARLVRRIRPDAALTLGDNQYPSGTLEEYRTSYARAWGRFKAITRPSPGNHEWQDSTDGYRAYFGRSVQTNGNTWYAFDLGNWHLISLDGTCSMLPGGCGPGGAEYRWLVGHLAQDPAPCTLAYWHEPRWSSGTTHGSATSVGPLWGALYAAGAELVLDGHEHNYERFSPQTPSGAPDASAGITEIVAGTGGAENGDYPFGAPIANSVIRRNGIGVVELTLRANGWRERFVRPDGTVVDSSSGTCH